MSDIFSPKRKDLNDRLRQRFENYRNFHQQKANRFEPYIGSLYENSKLETESLRDRYFNSKPKKPKYNRNSKSNSNTQNIRDSISSKSKAASSFNNNNYSSQTSVSFDTSSNYTFCDNQDLLPSHKQCPAAVSVQIVHKINSDADLGRRIEANVTVSSNLNPTGQDVNNVFKQYSGNVSPNSVRVSSNDVECKQEEGGFNNCYENNPSFDEKDIHNMQMIFEWLSNEQWDNFGNMDRSLKSDDDFLKSNSSNIPDLTKSNVPTESAALPQNLDSQYNPTNVPGEFDSTMSSMPMHGHGGLPPFSTGSSPMAMSETAGPAAKTLKQMAAHHQNQLPYGMIKPEMSNNYNHFTNYTQVNNIVSHQNSNSAYSCDPCIDTGSRPEHIPSIFANEKSLSNILNEQGVQPTTSSLQQLQNQVYSQFNQSGAVHMSQNQQVNFNPQDGKQLEVTQMQGIQMLDQQRQMSIVQQQNVSVNGAGIKSMSNCPPYFDPVQLNRMQNCRQKIQDQILKQRQLQYVNRLPGDYARKSSMINYPVSADMPCTPSPLQTMQNMVNQTNNSDMSAIADQQTRYTKNMSIKAPVDYAVNRPHLSAYNNEFLACQQQNLLTKAPMNPAQQNAMARAMRSEHSRNMEYGSSMHYSAVSGLPSHTDGLHQVNSSQQTPTGPWQTSTPHRPPRHRQSRNFHQRASTTPVGTISDGIYAYNTVANSHFSSNSVHSYLNTHPSSLPSNYTTAMYPTHKLMWQQENVSAPSLEPVDPSSGSVHRAMNYGAVPVAPSVNHSSVAPSGNINQLHHNTYGFYDPNSPQIHEEFYQRTPNDMKFLDDIFGKV